MLKCDTLIFRRQTEHRPSCIGMQTERFHGVKQILDQQIKTGNYVPNIYSWMHHDQVACEARALFILESLHW